MLYVIIGRDGPGSLERRKHARSRHLERIGLLADLGRVAIAGPCPVEDLPDPTPAGFTGSVIIAEFDSLDEARAWISDDPYVTEGVFETWDVRPFIQVLP